MQTILQRLLELSRSEFTPVGVIFDCAVDNAGLDGRGHTLEWMESGELEAIALHVHAIWDGRMLDYATDEDYAEVARIMGY
jgi:hypothetical protein